MLRVVCVNDDGPVSSFGPGSGEAYGNIGFPDASLLIGNYDNTHG